MDILEQCQQALQSHRDAEAAEIERLDTRRSQQTVGALATLLTRPTLAIHGVKGFVKGHVELSDLPGYLFSMSAQTVIMCRAEDIGKYDTAYDRIYYPKDIALFVEEWEGTDNE